MAPTPVVMSTKPLYLQNATNYTALDLRGDLDAVFDEGVAGTGDLAVTQRAAGTNMSVDVAAGTAAVDGDSPSGSRQYMIRTDALTNVTLEAAPGSNSRIDLIVATIRDAAVGGGANNDWILTAVTGTAGATPSPPTLPTSSIELAQVLVASGTSAITNAMITDRRFNMYRVGRVTANPAQVRNGQIIARSDTGDVLRGVSGVFVSFFASIMKRAAAVGATLFGGTPPTNTAYKWGYNTASVTFTAGAGSLPLAETYSGIVFFSAVAIGNGKTYSISRRTSGDSIDGDHIPITAIEHSVFGNANASGGITVTWLVVGW